MAVPTATATMISDDQRRWWEHGGGLESVKEESRQSSSAGGSSRGLRGACYRGGLMFSDANTEGRGSGTPDEAVAPHQ